LSQTRKAKKKKTKFVATCVVYRQIKVSFYVISCHNMEWQMYT